MPRSPAAGDREALATAPTLIDLSPLTVDLGAVRAALDSLAADVRSLLSADLASGNLDEIDRLVEGSQNVHRAAVALGEDIGTLVTESAT